YCLVSALNARSTYYEEALSFDYHNYVKWLPHSLDAHRTWLAFWNYLALACAFWAVRDWLPGKTGGEQRAERGQGSRVESRGGTKEREAERSNAPPLHHSTTPPFQSSPFFPARLRRLLWLLAINGAL